MKLLLSAQGLCDSAYIPTICGAFNSQGVPVIASTASAPPTPIAIRPNPPAFGVCESEVDKSKSTADIESLRKVYPFRACYVQYY